MSNGTLQHLRPFEKLIFFIVFCILSGAVFSLLSVSLASKLFAVPLEEFTDLASAQSIHAIKFTNLFFHLGTFVFPAIIFSKLFAFDPHDYLLLEDRMNRRTLGVVILVFIGLILSSDVLLLINKEIVRFLPKGIYNDMLYEQAVRDKTVFAYIGGTYKSFFVNVVLLALIPAIGEELVFRGVLQHLIAKMTGKIHFSIWFTAFVFAFIHFQFIDFLPRFILGAAFGYVVVLTGNLKYSIVLHFLNNLLFVAIEFLSKRGVLTIDFNTSFIYQVVLTIISFALLFWSFYLLSKKSNYFKMKGIYLR